MTESVPVPCSSLDNGYGPRTIAVQQSPRPSAGPGWTLWDLGFSWQTAEQLWQCMPIDHRTSSTNSFRRGRKGELTGRSAPPVTTQTNLHPKFRISDLVRPRFEQSGSHAVGPSVLVFLDDQLTGCCLISPAIPFNRAATRDIASSSSTSSLNTRRIWSTHFGKTPGAGILISPRRPISIIAAASLGFRAFISPSWFKPANQSRR